jgi:D-serine ammonia-lyase
VKTHKTTELTRLQVGEDCKDVRLVVSTLVEAEQLVPMLLEYKSRGAAVNVLYGVPLGPSQSGRLGAVGKTLGSGSVSAMIDDVGQLAALKAVKEIAGFPPAVFVKIDTGYHRAGRESGSGTLKTLLAEIQAGGRAGILAFQGYYSHASDSYGNSTAEEAMCRLVEEVQLCAEVGRSVPASLRNGRKPVISVGASPTAVSIQNIRTGTVEADVATSWHEVLKSELSQFEIEIHSGVYPLLDLQQVATNARHFEGDPHDSIALTILAEVRSLYLEREPQEALVAAGTLALGREPCKSYSGWGLLTPEGFEEGQLGSERLMVQRISQEHGMVSFENGNHKRELPLRVGQKVRIWPNHACIASAGYDWYSIVDSSLEVPNRVVDIWVRWRGW